MSYFPRTDVSIGSNGFLIEIAVPGVDEDDVKIEITKNTIVVSGIIQDRDKYSRYSHKELYRGRFLRKYPINTRLFDLKNTSCNIYNGLITIKVPHTDQDKVSNVKVLQFTKQDLNLDIQEGEENGSTS